MPQLMPGFRARRREVQGLEEPAQRHRRWSSRQLHRLGTVASHAWAGLVVAVVALGWVAYGAAAGFPSYWQAILSSVTSVVTVILLFAIQHLQARDQTVTQRKLDELLRAMPQADNRIIAVEHAPDEELEALTELNRKDRADQAASDVGTGGAGSRTS
jgi:low affinity Fe/Cu permease